MTWRKRRKLPKTVCPWCKRVASGRHAESWTWCPARQGDFQKMEARAVLQMTWAQS